MLENFVKKQVVKFEEEIVMAEEKNRQI